MAKQTTPAEWDIKGAWETVDRIATKKLLDDYADDDSNISALAYEIGELARAVARLLRERRKGK